MKDQTVVDALILEARARYKDLRKLEMKPGKADYHAKLMADTRNHLAMLRKLKKPTPAATDALVTAVAKSLRISLQQLGPLNPALMRWAAERAVEVFHNQQREAAKILHRAKAATLEADRKKLIARYQSGKHGDRLKCVTWAMHELGMKEGTARKALTGIRKRA